VKGASLVVVTIVALIVPVAALAHRPAIRAEKAAMAYEASGRYYGGMSVGFPRSVPLRCFVADITTVVKGSRWGALTWSRYADQSSHERKCRTANGITIEHKIGRRWYVLWAGSSGYPPTHTKHEGSLTLQGVPRAIAKDLIAGLA
jgi:hypothetical protein